MGRDEPITADQLAGDTRLKMAQQVGLERVEYALEHDGLCGRCQGSGYLDYPDTSTWRRRPSGQAFTVGVCDLCWGSGTVRPWPSHAQHEALIGTAQQRDEYEQLLVDILAGVTPNNGQEPAWQRLKATVGHLLEDEEDDDVE